MKYKLDQEKPGWRKALGKRKQAQQEGPQSGLGAQDPIWLWFGSWRENHPNHPFNNR